VSVMVELALCYGDHEIGSVRNSTGKRTLPIGLKSSRLIACSSESSASCCRCDKVLGSLNHLGGSHGLG
jgi:hypothetical protein